MEELESGMEARVWDRVFAAPAPESEDLRPLIYGAAELALLYERLERQASGQRRQLLRQLKLGERENLACLKGMQRLRRSEAAAKQPWVPRGESMARTLESCYHKTRQAMAEYTARSAESQFGAVFQEMAQRQRLQCARLTKLLGML